MAGVEFGVGALPEEEAGEVLLAASADEEMDVGAESAGEVLAGSV